MKHCPNCVTELQLTNKKLGKFNKWLTCPECGFRTRPYSDVESPHIITIKKDN
jgi:hypothetical protein